ncbi:MAG: HAD family hydrolase [Clostridia bacterium]|nr:HAD family hydrolase [Clostridia bacterium]
MKNNFKKLIKKHAIRLVIVDVDGTIKDLYREHNKAIEMTFQNLRIEKSLRAKFAMWLNKFGMMFFKLGCLPTNAKMQHALLRILSIVTLNNYEVVKELYYRNCRQFSIVFKDIKQELLTLPENVKVILASTNHYTVTENLKLRNEFGVSEIRNKIYKDILKKEKIKPERVLVIGDNFFDDYVPAKCLGCKVYLVNNYNSCLKAGICKLINK